MISLGGVIGQGLFLSAGGNLNRAGPAGALIAYFMCWSIIVAAELVALPLVMSFWTDVVPDWACKVFPNMAAMYQIN